MFRCKKTTQNRKTKQSRNNEALFDFLAEHPNRFCSSAVSQKYLDEQMKRKWVIFAEGETNCYFNSLCHRGKKLRAILCMCIMEGRCAMLKTSWVENCSSGSSQVVYWLIILLVLANPRHLRVLSLSSQHPWWLWSKHYFCNVPTYHFASNTTQISDRTASLAAPASTRPRTYLCFHRAELSCSASVW